MALNAKGKKDISLTGPLTCHRNFRTSPVKAKCRIYYIPMHMFPQAYQYTSSPVYTEIHNITCNIQNIIGIKAAHLHT